MKTTSSYDVLISGAGPVGLFLACELALANCSVLILEKAAEMSSPLKQLPFGIRGLSAPSIEALDRRGLLDELSIHKRLKNPHLHSGQGARRQVGHFAGIPFHEGNVDASQWIYRLPGSTETSLMSEMQELETVLTRRAEALGVEIRRGVVVTGFDQTAEGVSVEFDGGVSGRAGGGVTVVAGGQPFHGQWLVGCDGSRSVVRKAGGFEFAGTEPEFTGYTAKVEIVDPEKLKPGRNLTPQGMYLQSQPGYFAIQDFDGGAFHHSGASITLGHLQEVLRRVSGTDITLSVLHIATTWTDRARQATTYRNGRVLLAGDAAHIHAPLGGQGLNLGLGDAMNLGWKLAAVVRGEAPEGLLDSYFAERHPVGVQVLDWSRAQAAVMKPDPGSRALNAVLRDLMETRDGATYFAGRVWRVNLRYDLGGEHPHDHTVSDHPLVGRSVPNFSFEDGGTVGELMRDGRGLLIDFSADGALQTLAAGYGRWIRYISDRAEERLGLTALLVRPDGFVVWVAGTDVTLKDAAARWFGQPA